MLQTSSVDGAEKVKGRYEKLRNEEVYALLFHNQGNEKTYIIVFYIKKKLSSCSTQYNRHRPQPQQKQKRLKRNVGRGSPHCPHLNLKVRGRKRRVGRLLVPKRRAVRVWLLLLVLISYSMYLLL